MVSRSSVLCRRTFAKPDNYSPTTSKGNKCVEFPTGRAYSERRDQSRTRGLTPAGRDYAELWQAPDKIVYRAFCGQFKRPQAGRAPLRS